MPFVPRIFAKTTEQEIEEWGYLGLSETVVFDMLGLTTSGRKIVKTTDKWNRNYRKGLARREMYFAQKLSKTDDTQLIKEALKGMSLTDKKIVADNEEFEIEAPDWMRPKMKTGKKGQKHKAKDKRISVQPVDEADISR